MDQHPANWDHCLEHAALTHVGLRRANNQDAMAVVLADGPEMWLRRGHLFTLADGMGAHAAGERASKLAADTIVLSYTKRLDLSAPEAILAAVHDANHQIHSRGAADPEFEGMGTTSTSLILLPQGALVAHVGDSRAYRLRGDRYEQFTFDHSLVWEVRSAGQMPDDQLPRLPRNIITRSLGPSETTQVDLEGPFPTTVGDTFLLCSDGLSGPVSDDEMAMILASMSPAKAVQALVDLANLRGGPDNVTVIVVRLLAPKTPDHDQQRPRRPAGPSTKRAVQPLIWTLLGISALAAVATAATGYWLATLACVALLLAGAVRTLLQRSAKGNDPAAFDRVPLGKGPYTSTTCKPNGEFVERLTEIVGQLRDAAGRQEWTLDWPRLDRLSNEAAAAAEANDYARSIREYFHVIDFMLGQLKQHGDPAGGDTINPSGQ